MKKIIGFILVLWSSMVFAVGVQFKEPQVNAHNGIAELHLLVYNDKLDSMIVTLELVDGRPLPSVLQPLMDVRNGIILSAKQITEIILYLKLPRLDGKFNLTLCAKEQPIVLNAEGHDVVFAVRSCSKVRIRGE